MLITTPIRALKDNYIWLVINQNNQHCIIIDPGEAAPVLKYLKQEHLIPEAILITHHHDDHTAGFKKIIKQHPIPVYDSNTVKDMNLINFPNTGIEFTALATPGHTEDHIAYYGNNMLFSGDALFSAGCGRVFEGTMQQMYNTLKRLAKLPDNTLIYCAHEYTLDNLKFAQTVEPSNITIQERITKCQRLLQQQLPTLPSTIGLEKASNPFLRCEEPTVIEAAHRHSGQQPKDAADTFRILREWKNSGKIPEFFSKNSKKLL
jgi:hydroxyacylglutathione hydrolase